MPSRTPGHKWTFSHWPLSTHSASTQAPSSKYRPELEALSKARSWTSCQTAKKMPPMIHGWHLLGSLLPGPNRIPENSLHVLCGQQHLPEPPLPCKPPSTRRGRSRLPKDRFRLRKSIRPFINNINALRATITVPVSPQLDHRAPQDDKEPPTPAPRSVR